MYYCEGLSQEEISQTIHLSRSSVSRMLKLCLEKKIVEFRINDTDSMKVYLQDTIKEKFGLKKVLIVPTGFNHEETIINLGKEGAKYLESVLVNGINLGVAWGTTLYYLVQAFFPERKINVDVIQLIGGTCSRDIETDGLELTTNISKRLKGNCYVFHAPLIVQNKILRDMLLQEPDISAHFKRFNEIQIALVGIGSSMPDANALVKAGYITPTQSEELMSMGVVGNICGNHIDINGTLCNVEMNERTIGIGLEELKRIPNVIGIAAGKRKIKPILASLRGNIIDTLITDEITAIELLKESKDLTK